MLWETEYHAANTIGFAPSRNAKPGFPM
jgi:hypothetical protein